MIAESEVTVYDNGGKTADRYTVVPKNPDWPWLGVGETGNVPNGFCMTVDGVEGDHLGEIIFIAEMSPAAQRAVDSYYNDLVGQDGES